MTSMIKPKIRQRLQQLSPSDTLLINEVSRQLEAQGKEVFKFGFGQSPFPIPGAVQSTLASNAHQKAYLPVQGLPELRESIAVHMNRLLDRSDLHPDQVFVGPGSKELIFLTQLSLDLPLLLPSPSWVSYAPQAQICGNKIHWIPTARDNWKLTPDLLEEYLLKHKISEGLLLLNYPCNPTGVELNCTELEAMAAVCRKYELTVISDEIYGLTAFDGAYKSISNFYPEGTIVSSGLSKWCGAGGYRLGFIVLPERRGPLIRTLQSLASETYSCASAPVQYAAVSAFKDSPDLMDYREAITSILAFIARHTEDRLKQIQVLLVSSAGGFYLFPSFDAYRKQLNIRNIRTSRSMCDALLRDTGVAVLPGSAFGRPEEEFTCRLSYVDFDGALAFEYWMKNGLLRESSLPVLFPKMEEGLNRLINWFGHQ